jgi:hypothetical protein
MAGLHQADQLSARRRARWEGSELRRSPDSGPFFRLPPRPAAQSIKGCARRGLRGAGSLRDACALIAAAGGNNYLPLLWRFYYSHRQALFRLARALELHPTTQDRSVLAALDIVLDHERSRREWLPITPDLSFASEQWHRTVLAERDGQLGVLRRHLEVCVFSYLASELQTGDVFVVCSEGYADYREQLLPSAQCDPQVAAYCRELGFPETAKGFVQQLQEWLTRAAEEVDRAYLDNEQLVITDKGEPVLKRPPRQLPLRPSPRAG